MEIQDIIPQDFIPFVLFTLLAMLLIICFLSWCIYRIISHWVFKDAPPRWTKVVVVAITILVAVAFGNQLAYACGYIARTLKDCLQGSI